MYRAALSSILGCLLISSHGICQQPVPPPVVDQPIQFQIPVGGNGPRLNGRLMQRFGGGRIQRRVQGVMGEGGIDLQRPRAQMLIQGVDMLLGPDVNIGADANGINVRIQPEAITDIADGIRAQGGFETAANHGLTIYPESQPDPNSKRLVVLIHGFNSSPTRMDHVVSMLRDNGYRVATFSYDSTLGVEAAALALSTHLTGWSGRNPDYKITLLTHSMGGVCARCMIEEDGFEIDAIDQLVMVAPPNHGSELARIGLVDQPLQNAALQVKRPQIARIISRVASQVNSAIGDMRPDSPLLESINGKTRNEQVEYSILLGNKAPLSEKQAVILAEVISELGDKSAVVDLAGQQAADTLDQVSQEVVGRGGDGVVSVTSGRLAGVDDIQVMSFSHNDLLDEKSAGWPILSAAILKRLEAHKRTSFETSLRSLVLEGPELHKSLHTRKIDAIRDLPTGVESPGNPHLSADDDFVQAVARGGSQGRLGRDGIRTALFARYSNGENELGFYGLEAETEADADEREKALREIWAHNGRHGRSRVHRKGLVLLVIWHDDLSPECWQSVNATVVNQLKLPAE